MVDTRLSKWASWYTDAVMKTVSERLCALGRSRVTCTVRLSRTGDYLFEFDPSLDGLGWSHHNKILSIPVYILVNDLLSRLAYILSRLAYIFQLPNIFCTRKYYL